MSEKMKRRRLAYKQARKKWIQVQLAVIAVFAVALLLSAFTYHKLNQTYYIGYTEDSSVDYKVYLKDNDFYEEEWLGKGQSYVASLIDRIAVDFDYVLNMEAANINYEYSYGIVAELQIVDNGTGQKLYSPKTVIKPVATANQSSNTKLRIEESFDLDYVEFNNVASSFVNTYDLRDVTCTLVVTMNVNVKGSCAEFESDSNNSYNVALNMPLTNRTVDVEINSTVPTSEGKVLACVSGVNQDIFKNTAIAVGVIEALLLLFFIAFVYLTRNDDINYSIKVKRIVSNYKSYIQKITNEFDTEGYQILKVDTFTEMLGIRDTIQSPVLMCENEDQTRTRFVIPTNTKILYMYEIKVDNYDELYAAPIAIPEEPTAEDAAPVEETAAPVEETAIPTEEPEMPAEEEEAPTNEAEIAVEEPVTPTEEKVADETVEISETESETVEVVLPPEPEKPVVEEIFTEAVIDPSASLEIEEPMTEPEEEEADEEPEETASEIISDEENDDEIEPIPEAPIAPFVRDADDGAEEEGEIDIAPIVELLEHSVVDEHGDTLTVYDEKGNKLNIRCSRSVTANIIQTNDKVKNYYSVLRNAILSNKGVKIRTSWKYETFKKGRTQLFKLKIRGKTILLYCALDPAEFDNGRYHHQAVDAKIFEKVPMLVRIRSDRGLRRALELVDEVMKKFEIPKNPKAAEVDYVAEYPYERTEVLVAKRLIKILVVDRYTSELLKAAAAIAEEIKPPVAEVPKAPEVPPRVEKNEPVTEIEKPSEESVQAEATPEEPRPEERKHVILEPGEYEGVILIDKADAEELEEAIAQPDVELEKIDFVDEIDEVYEETEEKPGVDVIGVVWPERSRKNKIYRYDPNGETLDDGDVVLVPTRDVHKNRDVIRKVAVAHGNHKIDPDSIPHPLKKIIGVVKRKVEAVLTSTLPDEDKKDKKKKKDR